MCGKRGHLACECRDIQPKKKAAALSIQSGLDRGNQWGRPQGVMSRSWREREDNERENKIRGEHLVELSQSVEPEKSPPREYIEDGRLMLADGKSIPVASVVCDKHRLIADNQDLPVCDGYVGGHKVRVLRDSGCSSAAVRRDHITTNQLTGKEHVCLLIDGTIRQFPLAKISVVIPFFTGEVEAMCMKKPLYDLVIGNIPGVRSKPAENWHLREDNKVEISAVTTRAQVEREEKPLKLLKTPTGAVHEISTDDLVEAQAEDPALKKLWGLARKDEDMRTRGQQRYRMQVKRGLFYGVYDQPKDNSAVEVQRQDNGTRT